MSKLKILSSALSELATLDSVLSCSRTEVINGDNTLSFEIILTQANTAWINDTNVIGLDSDYFDIARYKKGHAANGDLTAHVECEHISYRLNKPEYNLDQFIEGNTPLYILGKILAGTPFSIGAVEITAWTTFSVQQAASRRALLMQFAKHIGGELLFEGFTVSILAHRGSSTPKDLMPDRNIEVISKTVDKTTLDASGNPTTAYECSLIRPMPLELGDAVTMAYATLGIDTTLRIVSLTTNPYNSETVSFAVSNVVPGAESAAYTTQANAAEAKRAVVEIGLTVDGIEARVTGVEGDIGTLELTATSLASRIETAEGDIGTLELTATSLTSRIATAEGNISTVTQTANKISWLIASGTSESNFTMTSRAIQLVADSIDIDGFVTFTNLETSGQTNINGGNITAGTISADRIDVANIKIQKLYTSTNQVAITSVGTTTLHLGGDGGWNYSTVNLYAGTTLMLGSYSTSAYRVTFSFTNKTITFGDANWDLGSSSYPLYTSYFNQLYANKVGAFSATDFVDEAYITEMRFGGTSLYHIVADARQLYPNSTSASYPFYLGTSTYPWHYAYIGSNTVMIGTTASSKLSFFGATAIARQTLSLSNNNMGYSSVTASNYLYALNNIIGILKNKYGLIA